MNEYAWFVSEPTEQGWYWALPKFPEDAYPEVIFVQCDDGRWSFGEVGRPASHYKCFAGKLICPKGWE